MEKKRDRRSQKVVFLCKERKRGGCLVYRACVCFEVLSIEPVDISSRKAGVRVTGALRVLHILQQTPHTVTLSIKQNKETVLLLGFFIF